jgi:hypothetical protein
LLAESLTVYEIALGEVVARPLDSSRYRRLFAEVEPTGPVMAANAAARAAFGAESRDPYSPHLSLAYADGAPSAFGSLKDEAVRARVSGVRFEVGALELWQTTGLAADWRRAGSFAVRAA